MPTLDALDGIGDLGELAGAADDLPGFLGALVFGLLLIVLLPLIVLVLWAAVELAVLLALLPLAVLIRVALRRPWTVQVIAPGGALSHQERVVGWRASGRRVEALAGQLREQRGSQHLSGPPGVLGRPG